MDKVIYKTITFLLIFSCFNCWSQDENWMIQLAVYSTNEKYEENIQYYSPLKKYGIKHIDKKDNGIVKVNLIDFEGPFKTRNDVNRILKRVHRYSKFKRAYIVKYLENIQIQNKNLLPQNQEITLKITVEDLIDVKKSIVNYEHTPPEQSTKPANLEFYKIRVGCFEKVDIPKIKEDFEITDEILDNYGHFVKDNECNKDLNRICFGKFTSLDEATKIATNNIKKDKEIMLIKVNKDGVEENLKLVKLAIDKHYPLTTNL